MQNPQTPLFDKVDLEKMLLTDQLANDNALREYKEARAYYHSYQLPPQVLSEIYSRGQMPLCRKHL